MTNIFQRKASDVKLIKDLRAKGKRGKDARNKLYDLYKDEILQLIDRSFISEDDRIMALVQGIAVVIQEILEGKHLSLLSLRLPILNQTLKSLSESHLVKLSAEDTDVGNKSCEILIARYRPFMTGVIRKKLGSGEDVEKIKDFLSEAIIGVTKGLKNNEIKNPKAFKAYCGRVVSNKAVDLIRKNEKERKQLTSIENFDVEMEEEEDANLKKDQVSKLKNYIERLSELCKTLIAHRTESIEWKEIAEIVGLEHVQTKKKWTRCFNNLTRLLKDEDPDLLRVLTYNRKRRGRK